MPQGNGVGTQSLSPLVRHGQQLEKKVSVITQAE